MIIKSADFVKSAVKENQHPVSDLPEIAFAGRSNVGKSSLINTLLNRRHLVKTSSTPGRTQLLNFFNINNEFMFVDLPGYGYAKVPKAVQADWGNIVGTYFRTRKTVQAAVLVMDLRREPDGREEGLVSWLHQHNIAVLPVFTKADKFSNSQQIGRKKQMAAAFGVPETDILLFSSKARKGVAPLWEALTPYIINSTEKDPMDHDELAP